MISRSHTGGMHGPSSPMISRGPVTHLISPKMTRREDAMMRRPYRRAVGVMIKTDEVSEQLYASSTLHDTRLHIRGDDSRLHQGWGHRDVAASGWLRTAGGLTEVTAGPSARVAVVRHGPWHTYIAHRPYHSATAVSPPSSPCLGPGAELVRLVALACPIVPLEYLQGRARVRQDQDTGARRGWHRQS